MAAPNSPAGSGISRDQAGSRGICPRFCGIFRPDLSISEATFVSRWATRPPAFAHYLAARTAGRCMRSASLMRKGITCSQASTASRPNTGIRPCDLSTLRLNPGHSFIPTLIPKPADRSGSVDQHSWWKAAHPLSGIRRLPVSKRPTCCRSPSRTNLIYSCPWPLCSEMFADIDCGLARA